MLFDLDGTLVDTAPDMVAVLIDMQRAHGRDPVPYELGRANVSNGAVGLLRVGFPDETIEFRSPMHLEYLERYEQRVAVDSTIFYGLETILDALEGASRPWGIVTNKPEGLTHTLLRELALTERAACVVGGDTLPVRKPDPAPMHHACEIGGFEAARTIYVGDADRDIEAGRGAGMGTIAAAYGYIPAGDDPADWGADAIAVDTADLAHILRKAVNL